MRLILLLIFFSCLPPGTDSGVYQEKGTPDDIPDYFGKPPPPGLQVEESEYMQPPRGSPPYIKAFTDTGIQRLLWDDIGLPMYANHVQGCGLEGLSNTDAGTCINSLTTTRQCSLNHDYELHLLPNSPTLREDWFFGTYLANPDLIAADLALLDVIDMAKQNVMVSNEFHKGMGDAMEDLKIKKIVESLADDIEEEKERDATFGQLVEDIQVKYARKTVAEIKELIDRARVMEIVEVPPNKYYTAPPFVGQTRHASTR
eukprot:sb/3468515/